MFFSVGTLKMPKPTEKAAKPKKAAAEKASKPKKVAADKAAKPKKVAADKAAKPKKVAADKAVKLNPRKVIEKLQKLAEKPKDGDKSNTGTLSAMLTQMKPFLKAGEQQSKCIAKKCKKQYSIVTERSKKFIDDIKVLVEELKNTKDETRKNTIIVQLKAMNEQQRRELEEGQAVLDMYSCSVDKCNKEFINAADAAVNLLKGQGGVNDTTKALLGELEKYKAKAEANEKLTASDYADYVKSLKKALLSFKQSV